MITIHPTHKSFWDNQVEGYILLMTENLESASDLATFERIDKNFYKNARDVLKKHQFKGKNGQVFVFTGEQDNRLIQFIFIGLGTLSGENYLELENLRRAVALAVHTLKKLFVASAVLAVPNLKPFGVTTFELVKQMTIAAMMADYEFSTYKSEKKEARWKGTLLIEMDPKNTEEITAAIKKGIIIGEGTSLARCWADMPANIMTPSDLAEKAKEVADANHLKYTVFGRDKACDLGMGGFCAVDAGSDQDGKFVCLEYKTATKDAPTIALIGKGVCFDTGGVSLKPSSSMHGMKFDMSGAAAVIAIMNNIGKIKPDINVVGITPLVENMPSGKAARQDDIVVFMNGKTAEIKSTDAEGRLIIADALCYAEKMYNPDVMIDIATLTGACVVSLGHFYTGLMTRDQKLAETLLRLGQQTGDKVWQLPLDDDFKEANKSDVADLANCGTPAFSGGTITAGCFLEAFVEKTRWAHLDIAGTANDVPNINYLGKGATGVGVRLLTAFILGYKK